MEVPTQYYYGAIVRKLFLAGAIIILVSVPFFQGFINYPLWLSIFAVLLLALGAALTSREIWSTLFNIFIAAIEVVIFEYNAVASYAFHQFPFFFASQVLALIFLLALYYAARTARGAFREND